MDPEAPRNAYAGRAVSRAEYSEGVQILVGCCMVALSKSSNRAHDRGEQDKVVEVQLVLHRERFA